MYNFRGNFGGLRNGRNWQKRRVFLPG